MSGCLDPGLVDRLARLTDEQRRDVAMAAAAERRRRIRDVLNQTRLSILPNVSWRKAARQIADAAHGRHTNTELVTLASIKAALLDELGSIDDIPDADRIRQLFE